MALYCDFSVSDGRRNPQSLLCAKIHNPVFIWSLDSMRLQVVESDEWVSSKVIQSFSYPLWVTELLSLSHSLERKHCENTTRDFVLKQLQIWEISKLRLLKPHNYQLLNFTFTPNEDC